MGVLAVKKYGVMRCYTRFCGSLQNISNKYADTKIEVAIWIEESFLAVRIEDHGGGVDESELPLLKEKFRRGGNTKDIEGAGLGLHISDHCMKRMQGRLDIANGSTGLRATVWIAFSSTI